MSDTEEDPRAEARVLYTVEGAGGVTVREWQPSLMGLLDEVAGLGDLCDHGWSRERRLDDYLILAELTEADLWRCCEVAHELGQSLSSTAGCEVTMRRVDLGTLTVDRAEAEEGS